MTSQRSPRHSIVLLTLWVGLSAQSLALPAAAQTAPPPITPSGDGTGTIVTDKGTHFVISGGSLSQDGHNLFQSFDRFGLNSGQVAEFLANPQIYNLLSRVVGGDPSFIDGLIKVTGGRPNLYFMNPAGIIFGSGARLDVPASFTATTATGIGFAAGSFSSLRSNPYNVLVGDPNSLIFAIARPGAIVNAGVLQVPQGANLSLLGGQVLNEGSLAAPGGSVQVAAVPGKSVLRVTPEGGVLSLDLALDPGTPLETLDAAQLPKLLAGHEDLLAQATDLAVQQDGSVWLVAPGSNSLPSNPPGSSPSITAPSITAQTVTVQAAESIAGSGKIQSDRVSLSAKQIGTADQSLSTEVKDLNTQTIGDQFITNQGSLTQLNLNAGQGGSIGLKVDGSIASGSTSSNTDPSPIDIQAKALKLETTGNMGTRDAPLQTQVDRVAAQVSGSGEIALENHKDLAIDTVQNLSGLTTQDGSIAVKTDSAKLTVNAPVTAANSTVNLDADKVTLKANVQSRDDQHYNGAIALGSDVTLTSENQGTIALNGTIDSSGAAHSLTVQTGGVTQFNGAIGSQSPLKSLETDDQGIATEKTEFNSSQVKTSGDQTLRDAIQLDQDTQFNGGNITFGKTIDSGSSHGLTGGSNSSLNSGLTDGSTDGSTTTVATPANLTIKGKTVSTEGDLGSRNPLGTVTIATVDDLAIHGQTSTQDQISLSSQKGSIQTKNLESQGHPIAVTAAGDIQVADVTALGSSVAFNTKKNLTVSGIIQSDRLSATANQIGAVDQPLVTQVNDLTTQTIGDQFIQQKGDLTAVNLRSTQGTLNLTTDGKIEDADPSVDIIDPVVNITASQIGNSVSPILIKTGNLTTNTTQATPQQTTSGNQLGDQFIVNQQSLNQINLNAGKNGIVSLTVQGTIQDPDLDLDIQAADLELKTTGAFGKVDSPLQTNIDRLAAQVTGTGGIFLDNRKDLEIGAVQDLAGLKTQNGTIAIQTDSGALTANFSVYSRSSNIDLKAARINLNSNIESGRNQTYQGQVILGQDVTLKSNIRGTIALNGTIDSDLIPRGLVIQTGGITQFNGAIGLQSPLKSLQTDSLGSTEVNSSQVKTIGDQTFKDAVKMGQDTTLQGQKITFEKTIDAQVGTAPHVIFTANRFLAGGNIGGQNPLGSITIDTATNIEIDGNLLTQQDQKLTSQSGFINTKNLQTYSGSIDLKALGLTASIDTQPGIQAGDIQVSTIQANNGSIDVDAKRFFRATDAIDGISIQTTGTGLNSSITIVHGGQPLNQAFVIGSTQFSNNGTIGSLQTDTTTVFPVQAFLGSVVGGNIQILAGQNNPPVSIQFLPPTLGNSLNLTTNNISTPLKTIEDLNTAEFQSAFGRNPIRQATPTAVQALLRSINHRNLYDHPEKFAAVYLYYNRAANHQDTIFNRGQILRTDDPPLEEDKLSLIVVTEKEIKEITLPDKVNRGRVSRSIQLLRNSIMDPTNPRGYKPFAAQLYDWIAKPMIEALKDEPVDNLMFVLGRGLRSIPLAALYNRKTDRFLIEDYGLNLVPSVSYLDDRAVSLKGIPALAMGSSTFKDNANSPLPAVSTELDLIRKTRPTQVLQNDQFTFENLQKALDRYYRSSTDRSPLVLHLATHADFGEVVVFNPEQVRFSRSSLTLGDLASLDRQTKDISYLQFFDRRLKFNDLDKLRLNQDADVELFVISACNTATGSDTAELGFAGLSLQMGARSALASLWQVSDVGTMVLMGEFYTKLNQNISRVQALRQAQLAILRNQSGTLQGNRLNIANRSVLISPDLEEQIAGDASHTGTLDLRHPFYWSAFTLIGSPW